MRRGTVCFITKEKEILLALIKYSKNNRKWNGIGGYVKEQESLEESVAREFKEETFIEINVNDLKRVAQLNINKDFQLNVFLINIWEGELRAKDNSIKEFKWFILDQVPYDLMPSGDSEWLPKILNGKIIKMKNNKIFEVKNLIG